MKWRPTLFVLHRDVGFLCFGLTIVYAVSGVAVNHREHWDPNYASHEVNRSVGPPAELLRVASSGRGDEPGRIAREREEALVERLCEVLGRSDRPYNVFWRNPERLSLFFGESDTDVVDYLPARGLVEYTTKHDRVFIRQFNRLHLNESRHIWTWFADVYAVLLLFLAVTGVVMVRGPRGLRGRGLAYATIGIIIPLLALLFLP